MRVFFPSWKFFDELGHIPKLLFRTDANRDWTEWRPAYHRNLAALFVNPEGNLTLAYVSLLEKLIAELSDVGPEKAGAMQNSTTYRLVAEFARSLARGNSARQFQFKVDVVHQQTGARDEVLISPELEI